MVNFNLLNSKSHFDGQVLHTPFFLLLDLILWLRILPLKKTKTKRKR